MTWWRRPLEATVKGATITLGSTVLSCALAIQVEKHTHRLFFHCAPHWYANVDYAYGISESELASVRQRWGKKEEERCTSTDGKSWNELQQSTRATFRPEIDGRSATYEEEFPRVLEGSYLGQTMDGHDRISLSSPSTASMAWGPQGSEFPVLPPSFPSLSDDGKEDPTASQFGLATTTTTSPSSSHQVTGLRLGDVMSHALTA